MARQAGYDRGEALGQALSVFWRKGYHATSLKDLESALDMRPGSIYAAFGSKEALFEEALDAYAQRSRAEFEATMAAAPTRLAGLAAHVRNLGCADRATTPSRACMLVKTVLETPDDDAVLRAKAESLMRETEATFARAFESARSAGEIAADAQPDRLASRLQAAIFGLRAYAQRTDADDRIAALADDVARDLEALAVEPTEN